MNASRSCMIIVFSLLIASFEFVPARADLFNDDQKDLVADIAKGAGGVLQQIIATRGAIRTAEVQAQAQAAAAVAAAQPPPVAPNVVPVNQLQAPQFQQGANPAARFQPIAAGVPFQPTFQGPYGAGGQYQGYPGYPGYPANPGYPAYPGYPGYPPQQQGFPQQVPVPPTGVPFQGGNPGVNPAANPGANPAVNPGVQGVNNGPNACSATDSSPQAVERCINAVRTNPNAFLGQFPCQISGLVPRKPLNTDFALANAAYAHSQDLARMGKVGHTGSDGSDVRTRVQVRAGFPNASVGENAAGGQTSAREVVFDWMCSAGHRENVMSCSYDSFGTGVVQGSWPYWVQNFGCRSGSCTC